MLSKANHRLMRSMSRASASGTPGRDDLLERGQPVGAAVDVAALALHLVLEPDQHGLAARVVRVPREDHSLQVEHLEHGELGEVGEAALLDGGVGEEDCVRSRLRRDAVLLPAPR